MSVYIYMIYTSLPPRKLKLLDRAHLAYEIQDFLTGNHHSRLLFFHLATTMTFSQELTIQQLLTSKIRTCDRNVKLMKQIVESCSRHNKQTSFNVMWECVTNAKYMIDGTMYMVSLSFMAVLQTTFDTGALPSAECLELADHLWTPCQWVIRHIEGYIVSYRELWANRYNLNRD